MNVHHPLLANLLQQNQLPSLSHQLISASTAKYDIKSYQIQDLNGDKFLSIYRALQKKYSEGQMEANNVGWHENERKIFVWFIVAYCYLNQVEPNKITPEEWRAISSIFFDKDPMLLKFQTRSIERPKKRVEWAEEEDVLLEQLVRKIGLKKWNAISKQMFFQSNFDFFKTSKQCRERWFNHLDKNVKKEQMSQRQDLLILHHIKNRGKKWSQIAQLLHNTRTQHQIKNRYHSLLRKYQHKAVLDPQIAQLLAEVEGGKKKQVQILEGLSVSTNENRGEKGKEDENGIVFVGSLSSFKMYSREA